MLPSFWPWLATLQTIIASVFVTWLVFVVVQNLSSRERKIRYAIATLYSVEDPAFERVLANLLGPPIIDGNRVTTLINGDRIFPAMFRAIATARQTITFETYIYWSGHIGQEFAMALAERARAGVAVHVLLDWVGSVHMDPRSLQLMRDAGCIVEKYHPLRWYSLSRLNNRTHRKLLVVDGKIGFIGGVGIGDEWLGDADSPDHWRDTHFQVEGPVVAQLQAAFTDNWLKTHAEVLHAVEYFPPLESRGSVPGQVFKSSPREGSASMRLLYLLSIASARKEILIANSYFVPDNQAIDALVAARQRGVHIEIIVPGPLIDTQVTRRASRARWRRLLEEGIEIYEYQPTVFHAKVMIVDRYLLSVGSTNFDNRSFRLNDEVNLNTLDRGLAEEQVSIFAQDKRKARQTTLEEWKTRPWKEKLLDGMAALVRSQV